MKHLGFALSTVLLICGCDDGRRFSSPTALSAPFAFATPSPTPGPTPEPPLHPVYGVVYETTQGGQAPIEGAWVTESSEFHAGVYTAADGSYRFTGLYQGANVFWVSKDGYRDARRDVTINGELRLDIELVRR